MKWTKGAALQNEGMIVIIEDGARNKYSDKKTGATKKKWCPGSAGGGSGSEQFDRRINATPKSSDYGLDLGLQLIISIMF